MLKKFLAFSITAIMIFSLSACGNKEAEEKGDYLSGNKWESTAGMLLDLDKEGTLKFSRTSPIRKITIIPERLK